MADSGTDISYEWIKETPLETAKEIYKQRRGEIGKYNIITLKQLAKELRERAAKESRKRGRRRRIDTSKGTRKRRTKRAVSKTKDAIIRIRSEIQARKRPIRTHIDFSDLNSLRQVNSLCWAESTITALFLAPAVRDYVWSKTFELQWVGDVVVPTRTIYPTFRDYDEDYLRMVINNLGLRDEYLEELKRIGLDDNDETLRKIFNGVSTILFVIVEKIRHVIYHFISQKTGAKAIVERQCETMLQKIVCISEFPFFSKIIGCASITNGGFFMIFSTLMKYAYDMECLKIHRRVAGPIKTPLFTPGMASNFSMVTRFSLYRGAEELPIGHVTSFFTDPETNTVVEFDNEGPDGKTFAVFKRTRPGKTYSDTVRDFKTKMNKVFGSKGISGRAYLEKGITSVELTDTFIFELEEDCVVEYIENERYADIDEFISNIPRGYNDYFGTPIIIPDDLRQLFFLDMDVYEEEGRGDDGGSAAVAAAGGDTFRYRRGGRRSKRKQHTRKRRNNMKRKGKKRNTVKQRRNKTR